MTTRRHCDLCGFVLGTYRVGPMPSAADLHVVVDGKDLDFCSWLCLSVYATDRKKGLPLHTEDPDDGEERYPDAMTAAYIRQQHDGPRRPTIPMAPR